jgi:RNA polymerase sigma-70 factor, ECF subfamily
MRRPASTPLVEQLPDREPDAGPARQLAEELNLALEELRPEYRDAFVLFHEQELSYAEIGAALSCPLGTVKTWVHRARRELIAALKNRGVFGEASHALRNV